jgi:hypothetical protein
MAVKAVAMTIRILERLASRLGYNVRSSEPSTPSTKAVRDDSAEIDWCKGAFLIQQSPASYQSILAQPTSQLDKVCKFCYLEISDYRSKAVHQADEDWSALASCHVLACSSFKDRRAAYRCFGCYISGVSKVHTSAAAMLDHIATCEEFTEKRTRSQMPPKTTAAGHGRYPSRLAQSYSDSSASSAPATPSTDSAHSPAPKPSKPRSQAPPPSNPIPLPTRNPPPVPPTEAGPAYPPRPEAPHSSRSIPGTFPMADPIEKLYQPPRAPPTPSTQQRSSSPLFRSTSTPRKPVPASQAPPPQPPQSPPHPPHMSPSRPQRTSWNPSSAESSSPPLPRLPAQVRQLMELGATKGEAENGLKETNWDVPQAADLIWRNRQAG